MEEDHHTTVKIDELFEYLLDQYAIKVAELTAEEISVIDSRSTSLANLFAEGGFDLRDRENAKRWLAALNCLLAVIFSNIIIVRGGDEGILNDDIDTYTEEDFKAIGFEFWSTVVDLNYLIYVNNREMKGGVR